MNSNEFMQWFEKEVKTRWPRHNFEWIEIGDWHWRLRDFDVDTLPEAVRQHKAIDDWRIPSLKKVYGYAKKIKANRSPERQRRDGDNGSASGTPEAHTYIMCVAKDDNGRGCVGWFVPILLWPLRVQWKPEDYTAVAEQQLAIHSRRGGTWEIFTNTTHGQMLQCAAMLQGTKPLDINHTLSHNHRINKRIINP